MFKLKIVGFDLKTIKKVDMCLNELNATSFSLPTKTKKIVVLKSPHVNKKAKEHFSLTQFKRLCYLQDKKMVRKLILRLPLSVALRVDYSGNGAAW